MKDKTYLHSSVNLIDYPFDPINISNDIDWKYIKQLIAKFNKSTNRTEKELIAKEFPVNLFPVCRFCGKHIINSNFKIKCIDKYVLLLSTPDVYCREIDGIKYYLSCCEDCMLEYFKDNPPKAPKYYFMKANKYGKYAFGYSEEDYKKICSMTVGITEDVMIRKWGEEEGKKRWKSYCDKQSLTNTYEYKKEKYGWTEEQFIQYNKSRAVTKDNLIKKYGDNKGLEYYNNYCDRQRYTCSLEYMQNEYGVEAGLEKYKNFAIKRAEAASNATNYTISKVSQLLFNDIYKILKKHNIHNKIYYADLNNEYSIYDDNQHRNYIIDFYDVTKNLIIEFQGDYWHANPNKYKEDDILDFPNTKLIVNENSKCTAKDIWRKDSERKSILKQLLNNPIYIEVWESDYKKDKVNIIKTILEYYGISNISN